LLLSTILFNGALMALSAPAAYANNCSTTGGQSGKPSYYYAELVDTDTSSAYGVGAYSQPYTWTLNSGLTYSHMNIWATLLYDSSDWSQTGYVKGSSDGWSTSNRVPYAEFGISGTVIANYTWASYAIIDNDDGDIEAWTYSQSGSTFIAHTIVYSSNLNTAFLDTQNMQSLSQGTPETSLEVQYLNSYSGTCDSFSTYSSTSGAVYTTSVSTSEPINSGTSWSSCQTGTVNSPYTVYENVATCSGVIEYYGS